YSAKSKLVYVGRSRSDEKRLSLHLLYVCLSVPRGDRGAQRQIHLIVLHGCRAPDLPCPEDGCAVLSSKPSWILVGHPGSESTRENFPADDDCFRYDHASQGIDLRRRCSGASSHCNCKATRCHRGVYRCTPRD